MKYWNVAWEIWYFLLGLFKAKNTFSSSWSEMFCLHFSGHSQACLPKYFLSFLFQGDIHGQYYSVKIPSKCYDLFAHTSISRYFFWQKYNLFPFLFSRWHPRPILRSVAAVWIRRFSTRIELPLPRRLRWSWEAIFRNHLLVTGVQNKVSRKLFPTQRQPRVRQYKQNIRILWWM